MYSVFNSNLLFILGPNLAINKLSRILRIPMFRIIASILTEKHGHTHSNTCFLKLPHFSETITKEIRKAIHKEGLDIQLAHTGPSLRQHLTKKT